MGILRQKCSKMLHRTNVTYGGFKLSINVFSRKKIFKILISLVEGDKLPVLVQPQLHNFPLLSHK